MHFKLISLIDNELLCASQIIPFRKAEQHTPVTSEIFNSGHNLNLLPSLGSLLYESRYPCIHTNVAICISQFLTILSNSHRRPCVGKTLLLGNGCARNVPEHWSVVQCEIEQSDVCFVPCVKLYVRRHCILLRVTWLAVTQKVNSFSML